MKGWIDEHRTMDQEDRANEAKGAMMCLHELLCGQDMLSVVDPHKLVHLHKACMYLVWEAIPDGCPKHPRAVNDLED